MRGPPGPRRARRMADVGLLKDGAVAVRDGSVLEVGSARALRSRYTAARTVDAEGGLVTPGFVDAHTHLPFAGDRAFELALKIRGLSYNEIARRGGGIRRTMKETRAAGLAPLTRLVQERTATMLSWGTTMAEAKSGYGLRWRDERKQLRAIRAASDPRGVELVPTFLGAHIVPPDAPGGRKRWVDALCWEMIPRVARERLAEFVDVFLDVGAYNRAEARRILQAAMGAGLKVKLHADEFSNRKGAELACDLGATSCEHLLQVSPSGIRALGSSETVAVLLPGVAALGFLEDQAPARTLLDAGVAVAAGTDFNPNCPVLTMPTVLQWLVYECRLTPAEALVACTTNAAHAVGRGDRVGKIVPGYQADLLVLDHPTVDDLAYWVGPNPVRTVIKSGRVASTSR